MGFKRAWRAVPADQRAALLAAMRLREAGPDELGPRAELGDGEVLAQAVLLPSGWFLVQLESDDEEAMAHAQVPELGRAAGVRELLAVDLTDTVMCSLSCAWRDGEQRWELSYMGGWGQGLEASGEPPAGWEARKEAALDEDRSSGGGSAQYEVPVDVAGDLVGFRHDQDGDLAFINLLPLRPLAGAPPSPGLDAETRATVQGLGLPETLLLQAAAGDANAQAELGLRMLQRDERLNRAQAALTQRWLEGAARQGHGRAQALLGVELLRSWQGLSPDPERGLALLEQGAAANQPDALRWLADYLYDKSVRPRGPGQVELLKDARSRAMQARVPELLMRAAAQGNADALCTLAGRIYSEVGTPRDDLAAKALMQLAHERGSRRAAGLTEEFQALYRVQAGERSAVNALAAELGADMRQLPQRLRARWKTLPSAAKAQEEVAPSHGAALAPLLLLVGHWSFLPFVLLAPHLGTAGDRLLLAAFGAMAAAGAWWTLPALGAGGLVRAVGALLAALPGLGNLVCGLLLLARLRRPSGN